MEQLKRLKQTRGRLKTTITRLLAAAENPTAGCTYDEVSTLLTRLETTWIAFENAGDDMAIYDEVEGYVDPTADYADYEERYLTALALFNTRKRSLEPKVITAKIEERNPSTDGQALAIAQLLQQQSKENELPKIQINQFGGDYKDWPAFKDLYGSTVHNRAHLGKTQKFHYLKSFLTGEAATLIKHMPITEATYDTAWERLNERYDRPRHIVNSLLDTFMSLPSAADGELSTLRKMADGANEVVRGLDAIGQTSRDCWLIHMILARIDRESKRKWIEESRGIESPTVDQLFKFLDIRCEEIELSQRSEAAYSGSATQKYKPREPVRTFVTVDRGTCLVCISNEHNLYGCPQFHNMSVEQRRALAIRISLCFNCLKPGHLSQNCGSKSTCKTCNGRHHTLIHGQVTTSSSERGQRPPAPTITSTVFGEVQCEQTTPLATSVTMNHITQASFVSDSARLPRVGTLPTALVNVRNSQGTYTTCRVLLDSGSELSYISERCINALGIPRSSSRILVSGISSVKAETTRGCSTICIKSRVSPHTLDVVVHVLGKITASLPRESIDASALLVFDGIQLADTAFNTTSPIDLLLGTDHVWTVFTGQKLYDKDGNTIAISSIFGWVITSVVAPPSSTTTTLMSMINIDASLQRFWEIEDMSLHMPESPENDPVEQHFSNTHSRDANGRYMVELPLKTPNPQFAGTLHGALSRFNSVERRLQRDASLHAQYVQFMRDYIELGHMRKLPTEEAASTSRQTFYMPHHPVVGKKLRVVFDGSARDGDGNALNDTLHIGPSTQRNLFDICLRFRMHRFVFSADIVKMFRQIWVTSHHRNYQRIVWREAPSAPLEHYQLCTVTYGTSCAPFLAIRVLQQLAMDYKDEFPTASKILLEDFYVDDVLTGSHSEEDLLHRRDELVQLMSRAKFELAKWVSNSKRLHNCQSTQTTDILKTPLTSKVLGIHWNPENDTLTYRASLCTQPTGTKRQVLSDVARIFDPLGLLAPVVVQFKILFQELWLLDLQWDTPLPSRLADWWRKCRADVIALNRITLPRYIANVSDSIELHAFSDASIKAYAAVVYSRVRDVDGNITVSIIAAKTRVAPLKQQTLPRLELCGALLVSRLIRAVKAALHYRDLPVYAWCDSTIVLSWLSLPPSKLKTFVGNRTAEILDVIPRSGWRYVNTKDNPADCASRGMLAGDLFNFHMWWKGPSWLYDNDLDIVRLDNLSVLSDARANAEIRTTVLTVQVMPASSTSPLGQLLERTSVWTKFVRIVAYVLRFAKRVKSIKSATLTFNEIHEARIFCLQHAQACFEEDRKLLIATKSLRTSSILQKLSPIICEEGLLRVGGRLGNSLLPSDVKHPIILPKGHRISKLILEHEHRVNLHPGVSALFVIVRQRYWIVGARNLIRRITHDCLRCFRQRQQTTHQFMADLPAVRVRQSYVFENTGCDYAGPIVLKERKGRNPRKGKGYICLFVCLTTSALHLELATDLSTETFLAALRRFTSRRGKCAQMYSDNGTNFVGAKRKLDEMQQLLASQQHNDMVSQTLAQEAIRWHFIPPQAPHWGGKWESAVRSVKLHLRRVIGNTVLTFEQMHTLLAQIEAVVNSRPLFATSDLETSYLSPAHFMIGRPYTTIPEGNLADVPVNRLGYWQHTQSMFQGFWKRWHQEYLTTLQQRPKWATRTTNVSIGNIVLLKDSNTPPASWPLACVLEVYPGSDGLVRAVKLKTSAGDLTRPITKIAVLPHAET